MPDIPPAALAAATAAIRDAFPGEFGKPGMPEPDALARAALEAAAPLLAAGLLRPPLKRHPRIEGEWGPSCGTCWIRSGGRAAWPCAEVLAISVLLPLPDDEIPEVLSAEPR